MKDKAVWVAVTAVVVDVFATAPDRVQCPYEKQYKPAIGVRRKKVGNLLSPGEGKLQLAGPTYDVQHSRRIITRLGLNLNAARCSGGAERDW